jgi:hypothetical protein
MLYTYTAMTEGWNNGKWALFKCPLCGSNGYVEVRVQKPNGHWYITEFYQCCHCSVMFRDPVLFTQCRVDKANVNRGPQGAYTGGSAAPPVKPQTDCRDP